ncbi:DUF418 domain-containing protein [soil metagenome]
MSHVNRRFATIDSLRAFALFGVIVVNMTGIVMRFRAEETLAIANPLDDVTSILSLVFLFGKSRSAFALLFGLGFGLMLMAAQARGGDFRGFFARRMVALLAIGLVNQLFLFWGDILVWYALLGSVLLLARPLPDRQLLRLGLFLNLVPPLLWAVLAAVAPPRGERSPDDIARAKAVVATYEGPHYFDVIIENTRRLWTIYFAGPGLWVTFIGVLGLFMLGYWIARRGVLTNVAANRRLLVRTAAIGVPIGLALSAVTAANLMFWKPTGLLRALPPLAYVGAPMLALGYMALAALVLDQRLRWVKTLMAPVGRMALTNYLISGALGCLVFYGYGLGLMGKVSFTAVVGVGIAQFIVLTLFSHLWLAAFRHGPLEWLWRSLSHGQRQPMSKSPSVTLTSGSGQPPG